MLDGGPSYAYRQLRQARRALFPEPETGFSSRSIERALRYSMGLRDHGLAAWRVNQ